MRVLGTFLLRPHVMNIAFVMRSASYGSPHNSDHTVEHLRENNSVVTGYDKPAVF